MAEKSICVSDYSLKSTFSFHARNAIKQNVVQYWHPVAREIHQVSENLRSSGPEGSLAI